MGHPSPEETCEFATCTRKWMHSIKHKGRVMKVCVKHYKAHGKPTREQLG